METIFYILSSFWAVAILGMVLRQIRNFIQIKNRH